MVNPVLITLLIVPFGVFLSSLWGVFRNYRAARTIGLPIIFLPISLTNLLWMMLVRHVMPLLESLPFGSGYFTRFCYTGWEFKDKSRAHVELGDAFTSVTPGKNWVYLCNAEAVNEIIRRERQGEFARPVEMLAMLDVFGPNLSTVRSSGRIIMSNSSSPSDIKDRSTERIGSGSASAPQQPSTNTTTP
jgi:hypothetical protein